MEKGRGNVDISPKFLALMHNGKSWEVHRHTTRRIAPVSAPSPGVCPKAKVFQISITGWSVFIS